MERFQWAVVDFSGFLPELKGHPHAAAVIRGSAAYPQLSGLARFYQTEYGVLTEVSVSGLPAADEPCRAPIFGFHIHSGSGCGGSTAQPFSDALGHFNPSDCPHPYHAGDLPPLMGCAGRAYQLFLTDRFEVDEIAGLTVVIHAMPDDFSSQPAGAAGMRIACGVIADMRD